MAVCMASMGLSTQPLSDLKWRKCKSILRQVTIIGLIVPFSVLALADVCEGLHSLIKKNSSIQVAKIREKVGGKEIEITSIKSEHSQIKASQLFGTDENLILGFSFGGHGYVVAKRTRYDGDMLYEVRNVNSNSDLLSPGLFFRIRGSSQAIDSILRVMAARGAKGFTCVSAACKLLETGGLRPNVTSLQQIFPTSVIKELLTHGLSTKDGVSIKVEPYLLNTSFKSVLRSAYTDQIVKMTLGGIILVPAGAVLLAEAVKSIENFIR